MFISNADGKIYADISDYEHIDDGRPILFVIPGGPGFDHSMYKNNPANLEKLAHVVYVDPRNCGKSQGFSPETCTLAQDAIDLEHIRKHFNFQRISILGTSYGSMVALKYAIEHSNIIDSLILVAGSPSYRFIEIAKENLNKIGTTEQIQICNELLWHGNFKNQSQVYHFLNITRPLYSLRLRKELEAHGKFKLDLPKDIECCPIRLNRAFSTNFWNFDLTNKLKYISCQTTILFGNQDWINDPRFAQIMNAKIPDSNLYLLDSGHSITADQPEKYSNIIKSAVQKRKT